MANRLSVAERRYPTSKVRGRGLECPGCSGTGKAERSYPASEARDGGKRSYPTSEASGGSRGQGWRPGGATPPPRSGGYLGAGGPRRAIPR